MVAYPEFVGGVDADVTALMRAVPGLVAKEGFEGVWVAALPDGTAVAVKVEDGSERARQVAVAAILAGLGVDRTRSRALADDPRARGRRASSDRCPPPLG